MIYQDQYRLSGLFPVTETAPCFATPLLMRGGENHECIQAIDRDGVLLGFVNANLPNFPTPYREFFSRKVSFREKKPYIAFIPLSSEFIFGNLDKVADQLRSQADKLDAFPYVQRSIGRLLLDSDIKKRAAKNIDKKRNAQINSTDWSQANWSEIWFEKEVYRLTRKSNHKPPILRSLDEGEDEHLNLEELDRLSIGRLYHEANSLEYIYNESEIAAAFTFTRPQGNLFNTSDRGAFYCSLSMNGCVADVAWHLSLYLKSIPVFESQEFDYNFKKWTVRGNFADLRSADIQSIAIDPDNYAGSQVLAQRLRRSGMQGAIYHSPYGAEDASVVVFDPNAVVDGIHIGSATLTVDADGQHTISPLIRT